MSTTTDRQRARWMRMHAFVLLALLVVGSASDAAAQARGWVRLDLGGGRYARRYLPTSVALCDPLPLALFFHGAGGTPEAYESHLESHAEALGLVLLLPAASGAGWSDADSSTINAGLDALDGELFLDPTRTYVAGHSAGGAWAYILGYGTPGIAAVFSMSAPFYSVGSVADPGYVPPIHMYYGADDPNYSGGSAAALQGQWTRLGAIHETDVQAGFAHSNWPPSSVLAGLTFLLTHRAPGTPPASSCGGTDAGTSGSDAGASDAGARDVGSIDAATTDSAVGNDGGTRPRPSIGSCACRTLRTGGHPPPLGALAALAALLVRRRAVARSRQRWGFGPYRTRQ